MKIETLRYFVVTAQCRTITESAEKLYMAQPSLTKALHNLEAEIGCPLFERSKGGVVLTEAGKKVYPQARQVVEYYNEWMELGGQSQLEGVELCVARAYSDMLLPHILMAFRQRHPELPVNFKASRTPELYLSRKTTTPVIALFSCDEEGLRACTELQGCRPDILLQGECRCLVSSRSPLAQQKSVTLEQLRQLFLVLPGTETGAGTSQLSAPRITRDIFASISPGRIFTVESLFNVIAQVSENPGTYAISFYPALRRYSRVQSGELVALPFEGYPDPVQLCLFYSRQACRQHPLLLELVTDIRNAFSEFSDSLKE